MRLFLPDLPEGHRLPKVEKIVTETIGGKQVQKQIYADGSYGIRNGDTVERFFPDGKKQIYESHSCYHRFALKHEDLPDGTKREWSAGFPWFGHLDELPDGTKRKWYGNGKVEGEKLPDGTVREWYKNGQLKTEKLPDNTYTAYDKKGNITYHATKGVEDTEIYLAKERVRKQREKNLAKLEGKPEILKKIASSKAFNDIALEVAKLKVKITGR